MLKLYYIMFKVGRWKAGVVPLQLGDINCWLLSCESAKSMLPRLKSASAFRGLRLALIDTVGCLSGGQELTNLQDCVLSFGSGSFGRLIVLLQLNPWALESPQPYG